MNLIRYILLFLAVIVSTKSLFSQTNIFDNKLSNLRTKYITTEQDTITLDSIYVFSNSIELINLKTSTKLDSTFYEYHFSERKIIFKQKTSDTLQIKYRVFPITTTNLFAHKKYIDKSTALDTLLMYANPSYYYQPSTTKSVEFLDFGGLQYSGNFARGVQFGSNQDLSLNSNLDLRLSGKIGNDIEIIAALSDQNIPLQPDGSTQQIQDFDKIFIQINKSPHHIIAGDYNQKSTKNPYFLKFGKQLQGINYYNELEFKNKIKLNTNTAFAVARGKFARNSFLGQEGNQGPYRLIGNNNETFIIVLAGSEKVYVDGKALTRGETNDYVIDYNIGEIIFMPKFLITKDSRIVIEFEYADRNYFRSTIHNALEMNYKNLTVYTEVYGEQDAKSKPILNELNDSAKIFLASIGNKIENAFFEGYKPTEYNENNIQYKLIDTTVNSTTYDSVFVYSNNPNDILYQVSYTFVGANKGNYKASKNANNIRIYEWVAPINNTPQGTFEPIILLVTPKSQQMAVVGVKYNLKNMKINSEFAFSNYDRNTFSKIDNKDNKGYAAYLDLQRIDSVKNSQHQLQTDINYEYKQSNFRQIEQYRNVEFIRDWNISSIFSSIDEHLIKLKETYYNKTYNVRTAIKFSNFIRQRSFKGFEISVPFSMSYKNISINAELRQLNTKDTLLKTSFLRPTIDVKYSFPNAKGLTIGSNYLQENNKISNHLADSIMPSSFRFNIAGINIMLPDTNKWSFILDYKFRNDFNGKNNIMQQQSHANTIDFRGSANAIKNQNLSWNFTFRDLKVIDSALANTPSERTYLGRIEYGNRFFKSAIRSNFIYELGGGQERVRQFTYLQVQSGQGYYKWIDENNNNIRELNEFVVAQFNDSAQYVKVYTDINEYIRAYTTSYTQSLYFVPKAVWYNQTGFKKLLSKFQLQSYLNIKRKTIKSDHVKPFNPFILNSNDANIVNLSSNIRNTLAFNTGDATYYIAYTNQIVNEKTLLVNGYDTRKKIEHIIEGYYNIKSSYTINYKLIQQKQLYISDFFSNNNFDLNVYGFEPKFTYNYKTMIRTSINYGILSKKNIPEYGAEKMFSNKLEFEFRYSKASKNTLNTKFSFILVNYNSETASTKSYTILEGLQKGKNYIWNAEYSRFIGNNLELSLVYEGRKTGNAKVVNTGRAQLRAIF